jgi:hypothetical protein
MSLEKEFDDYLKELDHEFWKSGTRDDFMKAAKRLVESGWTEGSATEFVIDLLIAAGNEYGN